MTPQTATPDFRVVVSSCDAYADLWPFFFHLLFTHWPGIPQPVYLVSDKRTYADPRVATLALGRDRHWASNTLEALAQIPAETVLYLQDDYFLTAPVDPAGIRLLARHHIASEALATSLWNRKAVADPAHPSGTPGLVACAPENEWVFDFQAAFWDKEGMAALITPGWTPWHAEGVMNEAARAHPGKFHTLTETGPRVLPYLQAIRGGLWLPEGKALCHARGLRPNFAYRPCAPFQAGFLNRFWRSFLKRRGRTYRKRHPLPDVLTPLP
ncbi:hypothetical protein SAMN05444156_1981 [Verrucomicrobium sp. GAS474]|uniref:hypothetical protein n=1 Tax=Verrucomicrobium sp. GAS474 TaxID=1882831 RepID=UPI00087B2108|nr:hypothetical protein [Verrucomicrobium sp. GAS474]SDU10490.1 hypothetical protein SAMN05444156_1981 [Verrucomicrobium sp. GAS474]